MTSRIFKKLKLAVFINRLVPVISTCTRITVLPVAIFFILPPNVLNFGSETNSTMKNPMVGSKFRNDPGGHITNPVLKIAITGLSGARNIIFGANTKKTM